MKWNFLSETELAFFVAMEEKITLPPFWGTFGGNGGPGKIISPVAGSAGACTTRLFLLDHRTTCTVFRCSPCLPWQRWLIHVRWPPYPRLQALRQDPLDLSFWSFLTFLHHGIEKVETHLLWNFHNKIQRKSWSNVPPKLLACIGFLYKVVHKNGRLR